MFHLSSSSRKGRVTVLLDISSASIGAGIVVEHAKGKDLVWKTRVEYGYQSVDDYDRYVRTMYATLLEVGMKVKGEGLVKVKRENVHASIQHMEVRCIYGSPWVFNAVRRNEKKSEKKFQVTQKLLSKIQEDTYEKVLEEKQTQLWQKIMGKGSELEVYMDMVRVRGYSVGDAAIGQFTDELETQHFLSMVAAPVGEHVHEVIEKLFPNQTITYTSSTQTLLKGIQNSHMGKTSRSDRLLFAEITGEMTNVTLLKHEKIHETTSLSLGTNHLLRSIVPKASSAREARGSAEIQIKTKKDIELLSDLPEVFQEPMKEWQIKIFEAVKDITGGVTPPSKILVITELFWEKVYTTTLHTPCTIPGTQNEIQLDALLVSHIGQKNTTKTQENENKNKDVRLFMFTHSV